MKQLDIRFGSRDITIRGSFLHRLNNDPANIFVFLLNSRSLMVNGDEAVWRSSFWKSRAGNLTLPFP